MSPAKPPPRPARRPRRRLALGGLALLAVLGVAHGLAWRWATQAMAVAFGDWVAQRRALGWEVEHGLPEAGGWPFAAELRIGGLRAVPDPRDPGAFPGLAADRLVLRLAPPRLDSVSIQAPSGAALLVPGITAPITAVRAEALVALRGANGLRAFEVLAEELRATIPEGPVALRRLSLAVAPQAADPAADPALAIVLHAEGASLPPVPRAPVVAALGPRVEEARIDAVLTRPLPPVAPPAVLARAWREAGGVLELRAMALRWGPLDGEGRMTLTLDPALQPRGEGLLRIAGGPETLGALAATGVVPRGAARAAGAALALMARPPEGGGPPRAEVPVSLGDGTVALGRVPLLRHAPLRWP